MPVLRQDLSRRGETPGPGTDQGNIAFDIPLIPDALPVDPAMRSRTEPVIRPDEPVLPVMAAFIFRRGSPVGDLIMLKTVFRQCPGGIFIHGYRLILTGRGQFPGLQLSAQRAALLNAQRVQGNMLRLQPGHSLNRAFPAFRRLTGVTVNQVQADVPESGIPQGLNRGSRLLRRMPSAHALQFLRDRGLHPQTDTVDAHIRQCRRVFRGNVAGIHLKGDFRRIRQLKNIPDRFQDHADIRGVQPGGRTPAEIDRMGRSISKSFLHPDLIAERPDIIRDQTVFARKSIKVAVKTARPAKRDVDIQ